jgi:hypothetical protein
MSGYMNYLAELRCLKLRRKVTSIFSRRQLLLDVSHCLTCPYSYPQVYICALHRRFQTSLVFFSQSSIRNYFIFTVSFRANQKMKLAVCVAVVYTAALSLASPIGTSLYLFLNFPWWIWTFLGTNKSLESELDKRQCGTTTFFGPYCGWGCPCKLLFSFDFAEYNFSLIMKQAQRDNSVDGKSFHLDLFITFVLDFQLALR